MRYRMPPFRNQLSAPEIAEVLSFVRTSWGNRGGAVKAEDVAALRQRTKPQQQRHRAADALGYLHDRVAAFGREWKVGQMERGKSANKSTDFHLIHYCLFVALPMLFIFLGRSDGLLWKQNFYRNFAGWNYQ